MVATRRSAVKAKKGPSSPANSNAASSADKYDEGTNYVEAGIEANPYFFALILAAPFLSLLLAYLTSAEMEADYPGMATAPLGGMVKGLLADPLGGIRSVLLAGLSVTPNPEAIQFILGFWAVAFLLEFLPGKIETGPETLTGHVPKYKDNAVLHCLVYTALFWAGSNLGPLGWYDFGVIYDTFTGSVAFLNLFGE